MYNIQELVDVRVKILKETFVGEVVFDDLCAHVTLLELAEQAVRSNPRDTILNVMLSMITLTKAGIDISVYIPVLQTVMNKLEEKHKQDEPHSRN